MKKKPEPPAQHSVRLSVSYDPPLAGGIERRTWNARIDPEGAGALHQTLRMLMGEVRPNVD